MGIENTMFVWKKSRIKPIYRCWNCSKRGNIWNI